MTAVDYWIDRAEAEAEDQTEHKLLPWDGIDVTDRISVGTIPRSPRQLPDFCAIAFCAGDLSPPSQLYGHLAIIRCVIPLEHGVRISLDSARQALDAAYHVISAARRGRVAIVCNTGLERSALVAALAVMRQQEISGMKALGIVRKAIPNALKNPAYADWLSDAEPSLRRVPRP